MYICKYVYMYIYYIYACVYTYIYMYNIYPHICIIYMYRYVYVYLIFSSRTGLEHKRMGKKSRTKYVFHIIIGFIYTVISPN